MSFLDERRITIDGGKQYRRLFRDAIEKIYADREVRAVDHRARVFNHDLLHGLVLFPSGSALDERYTCTRACLNVLQYRVSDGEIYCDIVLAEFSRKLIDGQWAFLARDHDADLVAAVLRTGLD